MPSTVVPKFGAVAKCTPSRVWMPLSALAAGPRPTASTSARCSVAIVTGASGSNTPSCAVIHPCCTATAAHRYHDVDASTSENTIEPSAFSPGANARTTDRARYLRVSVAPGRKLYVPFGFGAKSSIHELALATHRIWFCAHPYPERSAKVTDEAFDAERVVSRPASCVRVRG